jgi:biopolymer transport protein ExbD
MNANHTPETAVKGESMNWIKASNLAGLKNRVHSVAFLVVVVALSVARQSTAQALQKGISVELAPTSSAVAVPDADNQDALIITVTEAGKLYFGIDMLTPDALLEKLKSRTSHHAQTLYIKADAKAPYACVMKVLDAAHIAGVASVTLLTTQPRATQAGTTVSPLGIEMELARHSPEATK